MRVGLSPTPVMRKREPGTSPPATSQKLAALRSPGTSRSSGARRSARPTADRPREVFTSAPIARSIRSVWSRVGMVSTTSVNPSAYRPASKMADLTWALATGVSYSMPCRPGPPPTRSGGQLARAPIRARGSTTLSIGRRLREASPPSSLSNGWAASRPASRRIVVPELPQSSGRAAARRPFMPEPRTRPASISTPSARRQAAVDATSAPADRPRTWLSPSAIAPSINARCEIDLSPGSRSSPSRRRARRTVAITWPSARARHAPPRTARPGAGRPRDGGEAAPARR